MEHKLDNIDRKIIEMLQKNARTPVKEIAKEVFLSSPAVSARIEHLEKNGLITGYHAQINPVFLGYHIKAFINLEVEPNQKKDFYPFIQSIPNVIECNCVTGDYSMAFHTAARLTPRARLISSPDRGFPSRAFNSASTSSRSIRSTSFRPLLYPSPPKSSTYISF